MTVQTASFRHVAQRFAGTLRSIDALRRLATRLGGLSSDCRSVATLLDDARDCYGEHDWILECPLEDEHWDRALPDVDIADPDYADMHESTAQLGRFLVRLSQWLQLRFAHALPPLALPAAFPEPCSDVWKARNAAALGFAAFGNATEIPESGPLRVIVAVADQCNYRCRTCYQSLNQDFAYFDISSSDLDRLGQAFRYARTVAIGGFGEPLLSPAAAWVLAAAKAAGAATTITTNGSMLQRLAGLPPLDRIEVSLDGASAKVLETIRSGARLANIVAGLTALSDVQRANTAFNVVVNKLNVAEITAIVALARRLGLREVTLQSFDASLPWHDDMRLTASDLLLLEEQVTQARAEAGGVAVRDLVVRQVDARASAAPVEQVLGGLVRLPHPKLARPGRTDEVLAELRALLDALAPRAARFLPALSAARPAVASHFQARMAKPAVPATAPYCLEPFSTMVVKSDGSINPCCKLDWTMGNINDRPLEAIWNGPSYRILRAALISRRDMPATCQTCRDPNRSANMPELLAAMTAAGAKLPRVVIPADLQLPPETAQLPALRKFLQQHRPALRKSAKARPPAGIAPAPPNHPLAAQPLNGHPGTLPRNELHCDLGLVRLFGLADIRSLGMVSGWAGPEEGHNWNDGPEAGYAIAADGPVSRLTLDIVGQPYVSRLCPAQEMTVFGNGFRLAYRRMSARVETRLSILLLPQWWFVDGERATLHLVFHLPHSARPKDMGDGDDGRELGFSFQSLCLRQSAG